ncbi:hypothetical protein [Bifidobacterium vansinderenii]|uniref:Uncharacterized protein n=1 Tax=Bifidobacterium vansinderenii TaxID=1984871 RepID=A0A229VYV3_9BIFI|nr:hypothetical protein [Bifidobacterium vansinderenii]OXN00803.1 hypothetical protein Tam10B_0758 [Bifidobacterium vansinderenii]
MTDITQALRALYETPGAIHFHEYLNARRQYEAELLHGAPPLRGWYRGDGIPRTAAGHPYEPLNVRTTL